MMWPFILYHESIEQFHKSLDAPDPYPTMLHSGQKCAHFCFNGNHFVTIIIATKWLPQNFTQIITLGSCGVWGNFAHRVFEKKICSNSRPRIPLHHMVYYIRSEIQQRHLENPLINASINPSINQSYKWTNFWNDQLKLRCLIKCRLSYYYWLMTARNFDFPMVHFWLFKNVRKHRCFFYHRCRVRQVFYD